MLKKSITFTNFNDERVTKEFYFHLSKAQILEMNLEHKGGLTAHIQALAEAEDSKTILKILTNMIKMSVGRKSADGNQFLDTDDIKNEFLQSPAFGELLMELAQDETGMAAAAFINGLAPAGLAEDVEKMSKLAQVKANVADKGITVESPKRIDESSITRDIVDVQTARVHPEADPTATDPTGLTNPVTPQVLTRQQLIDMDEAELKSGLAEGRYRLG